MVSVLWASHAHLGQVNRVVILFKFLRCSVFPVQWQFFWFVLINFLEILHWEFGAFANAMLPLCLCDGLSSVNFRSSVFSVCLVQIHVKYWLFSQEFWCGSSLLSVLVWL